MTKFQDRHIAILTTKSNFTLWTTDYIFTVFFIFNQIKYCNELLVVWYPPYAWKVT